MQFDAEGFIAYLLRNDRRNTTIRKHLNVLSILSRELTALTKDSLEEYLLKRKSEGIKSSYLNMFVNAVRLYATFADLSNDLKHFKQFRVMATIKSTLSDDEIDAFLSLPRRKNEPTHTYARYCIFWKLIADTGCRPGEIAKLKVEDIDWGRDVLVITQTKTNTPGQVPIPENHKEALKEYLANLSGEYLFPSRNGGNHYSMGGEPVIDNVDWHDNFTKRINQLGIKRPHLTPYSFRHSYATRLLEEEVSLFHVKKLMRHNDLKSTLVYEHLTTKDLKKAQNKLPRIRRETDPRNILQAIIEHLKAFRINEDPRFSYSFEENGNSVKFEVNIK